ncbi:MAG: FKBP-type peptidyl-prolyl cis-trans isomerase [Alphaproteobacteria bacterium]|nr:FKBP-type peptidyl-prolyl cis-trans isomerase [Alphaproteobacteria bacterium]MBU6474024.1 FKBP-type peptidyl-prolyl cis-trans isomerase [Alphaproteobacteria bacterium]MDE2013423.1 FKBP-type peptidyl-prolyl cis-trans isomerase [Alphaproteobacteria bacterium]MDE2073274.1 FKBP-type peptidyl-prolyl cis-trans isomerase [Alphaproteobacteria bacterium]MDE2351218.1 FKBP-type peptidyl-prolyl cis-trans isomerase [Alphaproteobacteria bacterium]
MFRTGVLVAAAAAVLVSFSAEAANPALSEQANAAFLAANAKKPGVMTTGDGLQYRIIHNGFGKQATASDTVSVYYTGKLIDGTVFDSTEPGLPASFAVNAVIPGWTEALERMREGDEWELAIPANLGYGARGAGNAIPPNQTLVFDVQLVKVSPPPPSHDKDGGDNQ